MINVEDHPAHCRMAREIIVNPPTDPLTHNLNALPEYVYSVRDTQAHTIDVGEDLMDLKKTYQALTVLAVHATPRKTPLLTARMNPTHSLKRKKRTPDRCTVRYAVRDQNEKKLH